MARAALKIVPRSGSYSEEGCFWDSDDSEFHTLHYVIPYPESFRPQLPDYFIQKFTAPDDAVLDPFCGRGTTALQSGLLGRRVFATDINPLSVAITRAKLEPADISEVALYLQQVNFRKPVSLEFYQEYFDQFYDVDTFRELVNLRAHIQRNPGRVSRFVELLALSLLHGHTAGYFSVYTFPQISASPNAQRSINDKRSQYPEYRAVAPRILRKAASVLRDGALSVLETLKTSTILGVADARNLSAIPSGEIDLVVTAPPRPSTRNPVVDLWLRQWFSGQSQENQDKVLEHAYSGVELENWLDFMNQVLLEQARVVYSGGRVVLDLCEMVVGGRMVALDLEVAHMVSESLARFWDVEGTMIHNSRGAQIDGIRRDKNIEGASRKNRVLILRRR